VGNQGDRPVEVLNGIKKDEIHVKNRMDLKQKRQDRIALPSQYNDYVGI
jgi:hypothetical protein